MLEQIEFWMQNRKLVRVVVNYGNNTVRSWTGYVKRYDQVGIVLEVPTSVGKNQPPEFDLLCLPWYTATEISAQR